MSLPPPAAKRRSLQIYAIDPMSGRRTRYRAVIDVPNEPDLQIGPAGRLIEVVDYDGAQDCYYDSVNLNHPQLLLTNGLAPNEADPRFHQQMVYAVASKVLETARRALGRPIQFYVSRKSPRLKLLPHAFYGANAFYDQDKNAILFGYFSADGQAGNDNLPGQLVFTCLSHDIIAHELTHAIVDRLRPYFIEPTNEDVHAFHEAFADLVALFQRYSYKELLLEHIRTSRTQLQGDGVLVELARQFGYARNGKALRSAIGKAPDPSILRETTEPHERGAILVSAVFDGFFRTYDRRIEDLLRLAAGGAADRPEGPLHPDLVARVAEEVSGLADYVLRMCFRAFDYLPPVDVTFGDFLRALVTADFEVNPQDRFELRFNMIEAFRARGIYAETSSLAEEALILRLPEDLDLPPLPSSLLPVVHSLFVATAAALDETPRPRPRKWKVGTRGETSLHSYQMMVGEGLASEAERHLDVSIAEGPPTDEDDATREERNIRKEIAIGLSSYASGLKQELGFDPTRKVAVKGFSAVYRIGSDQRLVVELVAQFVQTQETPPPGTPLFADGGIPPRAGTTVVFDAHGFVRLILAKPLPAQNLMPRYREAARLRAERTRKFIEEVDLADPRMAWADDDYLASRMSARANFRSLHGNLS